MIKHTYHCRRWALGQGQRCSCGLTLALLESALRTWKEADDFRFGNGWNDAETGDEMTAWMLENQTLDETARTALRAALKELA